MLLDSEKLLFTCTPRDSPRLSSSRCNHQRTCNKAKTCRKVISTMIKRAMTKPPVTNIENLLGTLSENDAVDVRKSLLWEVAEEASFSSVTVDAWHMMVALYYETEQ
jgi:hypothetical protein